MAARAELQLGMGIERIVVDRLGQRPFHHVGDACHQHDEVGDIAHRLIGIADAVIDMDRAGSCDQADEHADPDQHLESEGDKPHARAAHHGEDCAQRHADHCHDQHQRLVARIGKDHRDEAKGVDRLCKAVIAVETGFQSKGRLSEGKAGQDRNQTNDKAHGKGSLLAIAVGGGAGGVAGIPVALADEAGIVGREVGCLKRRHI